jgi:hypothetical protein
LTSGFLCKSRANFHLGDSFHIKVKFSGAKFQTQNKIFMPRRTI